MKNSTRFITLLLLAACAAPEPKKEQKPEVTAMGASCAEADAEARLMLIEQVIGSQTESRSGVSNGQLVYNVVTSSTAGFVSNYRRLGTCRDLPNGVHEVTATGDVNQKAISNALSDRLKDIGNPRMMILMDENVFGKRTPAGSTKTEYEFISSFQKEGFRFIDQAQYRRILMQEQGTPVGLYGDSTREEQTLQLAAGANAEILVIGKADLIDNGEAKRGSGLYSVTADVKVRILNVGTGEILSAFSDSETAAHGNKETAATLSIRRAIDSMQKNMKEAIARGWEAGSVTRLTFRGFQDETFLSSGIKESIHRIRGVNAVDERGNEGAGPVLEVRCYCTSFNLVREIENRKWDFSARFKLNRIKANQAMFDGQ